MTKTVLIVLAIVVVYFYFVQQPKKTPIRRATGTGPVDPYSINTAVEIGKGLVDIGKAFFTKPAPVIGAGNTDVVLTTADYEAASYSDLYLD